MAQVIEEAEDLGSSSGSDDSGDESAANEVPVASNSYFMCLVCMNTGRSPQVSYCGHHFCDECIRTWIQTRKRCPYCQAFVGKNTLIPINNEPSIDEETVRERRAFVPQEFHYETEKAVLPEIGMFQRGNIVYPLGRQPRFKPLPPQMLKKAPKYPIRRVVLAPNLLQRGMTMIILSFLYVMFLNSVLKD
ncbi:E3 ubiquitin-protein ligase RNF185 [Drosophila kikkawai]|uniref:RING-type E3 ubiquitin transferase n=1 Tax=Drosophila kikkawai TaxID=30033 RepID=A0A6P4ICM6_DROKI|nr:E3 ubiquitin-protein ligase RNF185 [Drosophila kikkawai]